MLDRMKGPILKTRDEIAVMDRGNRVVLEILEIMRDMVKPGVTTAQLNAVAEEELARRGAKSPFKGYAPMGLPPYPAVVCSSVNDVIVHGIPNRAKLQEGDILGPRLRLDLRGIRRRRGDHRRRRQGRPTGRGARSGRRRNVSTWPSRRCGRASTSATSARRCRSTPNPGGFHVIRNFVGHGIGRRMHEDPQVYNYGRRGRGVELREGMVLAVEPMLCEIGPKLKSRIERAGRDGMIEDVKTDADRWTARTVDGTLAAHFEHSIAVTKDGPMVLGR